jgi:hypothetical protein
MVGGLALFSIALVSMTCAYAPPDDGTLASQVANAERILIATAETDVDAGKGTSFQVEINSVLRGTGTRGKLANVINSGEKDRYPRYKAGRQYVLLLKKNPAGKGWVNLGTSEIAIDDNKVSMAAAGAAREEMSLDAFEELVAQNDGAAATGPARESPVGKWILVLSQRGSDFYVWLVEISRDGAGRYQARLAETAKTMSASTLKEFSIDEQHANLLFLAAEGKFDFKGTLDKGTIRGSIATEEGTIIPARLVPTTAASLKQFDEPRPSAGRDDYIDAASQDESFDGFRKFVKRHPDSPLVLEAYQDLIGGAISAKYGQEKFQELADQYMRAARRWGPRFELRAEIDLGVTLSRTDHLPELALRYLDVAEQHLTNEAPAHWKLLLRTERAKRLLGGDAPGRGLEMLRELHAEHPFQAELTWLLAKHAEETKDTETALALYGELVALPQMERMVIETASQTGHRMTRDKMPSRVLSRLWKEAGREKKELPGYLDTIYLKKLESIAEDPVAPRKPEEGTRVVLCELFTGSECPPCVGADVALSAIESTFSRSEVIVLRYQQHTPGPDPLANEDSLERFSQYGESGTPTLVVNGTPFKGPGGFMPEVPDIYRRLRKTVEPFLTEKIALKFEISAEAAQGKIAIRVKAFGLKTFPEEYRLRIALAEDRIAYAASNGIRFHEMVVRAIPSGEEGLEPEKGQLEYTGEIDLAKLKSRLRAQLSKIESSQATAFDDKPLEMKALHVVAFLQSDETGEVLQAAAAPVKGSLAVAEESSTKATGKTARAKAPVGATN